VRQGSSRAIRFVHIERPLSLLIAQKPAFRSAKLGRGGSITILIRMANSRHKQHRSRVIVRPLRARNAHSVALFARKSKRRREAQNIALRHRAPNEPSVLGRIGPIIGKHIFLKPPNKSPESSVHSQDAETLTAKPARRPRLW
jgi:hypothetical protein